jgi:hypothetical protein
MVNIYIDSNVIPELKRGDHSTLLSLNKKPEKYRLLYSTSHISDLLVGDNGSERNRQLIDSDLDYISQLTFDNCIYLQNSEVVICNKSPHKLYEDSIKDRIEFDTDDFCKLLLKDYEIGTLEHDILEQRFKSPLTAETIKVLRNPVSAALLRKHYPGLTTKSTRGDLLNKGWQQYKKFMQADEYKHHRNDLQASLNLRPNQFSTKEPFNEIDKIYEDMFNAINNEFERPRMSNEHAPTWFNEIVSNYLTLDMHGYHQDKIRVDVKNNDTMRNMVDDGFHAAFASQCDFYITNDKKTTFKTQAVYNKLSILTKIYTAHEFEECYAQSLINSGYSSWKTRVMTWLKPWRS